ncbi:hypothetical protein ANANG_G00180260 [Anguilla anguilla]|uniref:Uncharacterized protein n=1 Tax=Anguilla anguilla TaxID=7936 RepID=A0A9D3M544_ANGAN|nr:hypothetical protein ANANG_G00180260 [Anguilla anguilla]
MSLVLLSTGPTPAQGFVQILHISANHWVTAGILTPFPSTVRCPTAKGVHAIEVDIHCLCRWSIRIGKDPQVFCRRCGVFLLLMDFLEPFILNKGTGGNMEGQKRGRVGGRSIEEMEDSAIEAEE